VTGSIIAAPAFAQNAAWKSNPGSNDFNTGANWSGGAVPTGTASFGTSNTTDLSLSANATLGTLNYQSGGSSYTIDIGSNVLRLTGAGIVNNSGQVQTLSMNGGLLVFKNGASAGDAAINVNSGLVAFDNSSNAGTAAIKITNGGGAEFTGQANADHARIVLNNISSIAFGGRSGAGESTIIANFLSGIGFFANSSAENATIRVKNGSQVLFFDNSTGGNARFIADKNGGVDFSGSFGKNGIVSAGSIEGAGTFVIGDNFEVGSNNRSTEVTGTIEQCGCVTGILTKVGTGTLTLSGNNGYQGATVIKGGTIEVDGSIAASRVVKVKKNGTLSGDGKVSSVTVESGGTLAPGRAGKIGTLTVTGDLTFRRGSNYAVNVTPTSTDLTRILGTATLAGTAHVGFAPGSYMTQSYTILTAKGGRTGTFDDLTLGDFDSGFDATLTYTATKVILNLQADLGGGGGIGLGSNAGNVASAINTFFNNGGALPPAFAPLFAQQGATLKDSLAQLSGEGATGASAAAFQSMNAFLPLMLNPFGGGPAGNIAAVGAGRAFAMAGQTPEATSAYAAVGPGGSGLLPAQRWSVWAASYGGRGNIDGAPAGNGSHDLSVGNFAVAAGADYRAGPGTVLGFAIGGGGTNWDLSNGLGGGNSDTIQLGVYGSQAFGPAYVSAAAAFAWHAMDTDRRVTVGPNSNLKANFDSQSVGGRIEAGYRFDQGYFAVTPYAAVQGQNLWLPAYSEYGRRAFALSYAERSEQAFRTELGAWFEKAFVMPGAGTLALRSRLAWAHDEVSDPSATATFQSLPGASFVVTGAGQSSDSVLASLGAELRLANNLTVGAKFDGQFAGGGQVYAGTLELRNAW
jgi:autotransporter-associated beta strand protein